jgi:hypothetical protein
MRLLAIRNFQVRLSVVYRCTFTKSVRDVVNKSALLECFAEGKFSIAVPNLERSARQMRNPSCVDDHDQCDDWARKGECDRNAEFMATSCRRSCELCKTLIQVSTIAVVPSVCEGTCCLQWKA